MLDAEGQREPHQGAQDAGASTEHPRDLAFSRLRHGLRGAVPFPGHAWLLFEPVCWRPCSFDSDPWQRTN